MDQKHNKTAIFGLVALRIRSVF